MLRLLKEYWKTHLTKNVWPYDPLVFILTERTATFSLSTQIQLQEGKRILSVLRSEVYNSGFLWLSIIKDLQITYRFTGQNLKCLKKVRWNDWTNKIEWNQITCIRIPQRGIQIKLVDKK